MFLDTYEKQLLSSQENAMVHQGRIVAASLKNKSLADAAPPFIDALELSLESRIRIIDTKGTLLADTATFGLGEKKNTDVNTDETLSIASQKLSKKVESGDLRSDVDQDTLWETGPPIQEKLNTEGFAEDEDQYNESIDRQVSPKKVKYARDSFLYILSVSPINFIKEILGKPTVPLASGDYFKTGNYLTGSEVRKALAGKYGATARYSSEQRSIQIYSALPIFEEGEISGIVLISQSTYKLLANLYRIRLDLIKVFFWSVLLSIALSIILALTITRPIHKLRNQAETVLDARGSMVGTIQPLWAKDEIGDLSRSLATLSERLKEKIYFIDNFTADMLHELKNPLTGIKTSAEILVDDVTEEQKKMLNRISQESLRIEQLLSQLREVTRIDSQLDEENVEIFDIAELLTKREEHYKSICQPNCKLIYTKKTSKALAQLNPDRFYQIIDNFMDNAIGFTKPGSTIDLTLSLNEKKISVSVGDLGPGIPQGDMDKIFTRFFSSRKVGTTHSGLGLSIAFAIAAAYNGTIIAQNKKEGGTKMTLTLPLAQKTNL